MPVCLSAVYWSNSDSIIVSWSHSDSNVTGFEVQRKIGANGTWVYRGTTPPTQMSYEDMVLDPGTTYYYRVRTVNNGLYSAYCITPVSASTPNAPGGLNAPNLTSAEVAGANCNANPYVLTLRWTASAGDGHTHTVAEKSINNIDWSFLAIWEISGSSDPDGEPLPADGHPLQYTNYYVRLRAFKGVGENDVYSSPSNVRQVNAVQTVPTNLSATALRVNGAPRVSVTWTLPPAPFGVHHYRLTRTVDSTSTTVYIACNAQSYIDTSNIAENKTYVYKLQAVDRLDNSNPPPIVSGYGNADFGTIVDFAPSIVSGSIIDNDHINLLRSIVNSVRSSAGLGGPFNAWTDPGIADNSVPVRAAHIKELRFRLKQAYDQLGKTPPAYTDPSPDPPGSAYDQALIGIVVKKEHINQLRAAVKPITY